MKQMMRMRRKMRRRRRRKRRMKMHMLTEVKVQVVLKHGMDEKQVSKMVILVQVFQIRFHLAELLLYFQS